MSAVGHEHVAVQLPEAADLVAALRTDANQLAGAADDLVRDATVLADEGIDLTWVATRVIAVADRTADVAGVLDAFIAELVALDGRPGPAATGCYAGAIETGRLAMPAWWPSALVAGAAGVLEWRATVPYRVETSPVTVHAVVQRVVHRRETVAEGADVRRHVRREHYARSGPPGRVPHGVDPAAHGPWRRMVVPDAAGTAARRALGPVSAGIDAVSAGQVQLERDRLRDDLGGADRTARAATVGGAAAGGGLLGGGLGAKGGAAAGATVGGLAGPPGILAGAAIGGLLGAAVGGWGGSRLGEAAGRAAVDRRRDR